MFTFLQGHRTYVIAAVAAIAVYFQLTGHVSQATVNQIFEVLGIGAVVSLRAAIGGARGR